MRNNQLAVIVKTADSELANVFHGTLYRFFLGADFVAHDNASLGVTDHDGANLYLLRQKPHITWNATTLDKVGQIVAKEKVLHLQAVLFNPVAHFFDVFASLAHKRRFFDNHPVTAGATKGIHHNDFALRKFLHEVMRC